MKKKLSIVLAVFLIGIIFCAGCSIMGNFLGKDPIWRADEVVYEFDYSDYHHVIFTTETEGKYEWQLEEYPENQSFLYVSIQEAKMYIVDSRNPMQWTFINEGDLIIGEDVAWKSVTGMIHLTAGGLYDWSYKMHNALKDHYWSIRRIIEI